MARSFTYDAENRQVTATIAGTQTVYTYDGNGLRVQKQWGGQTTTYIYDAWGNLAAESSSAAVTSPCGQPTCYLTQDHLGSTRMQTDSVGSAASVVRYDYQPFGTELPANFNGRSTAQGYLATCGMTVMFTGQQKECETADSATGSALDWFQVRHMSDAQGRFQSPDPANAGADPANPQTWNGFAYVGNNPMSFTDPSGMFALASETGAMIGAESCGPVCAGIGAAIGAIVDGFALWGIFGGGGPSTLPPALATPSSPVLTPMGDLSGIYGNGFLSNGGQQRESLLACASRIASEFSICGCFASLWHWDQRRGRIHHRSTWRECNQRACRYLSERHHQ